MQLHNSLNELFEHMLWADITVWKTVLAFPKGREDIKVQELLYHIHLTHHAFLGLWTGDGYLYRKFPDFKNHNEILEWGKDVHKKFAPFRENNPELDLGENITVPWAKMYNEVLTKTDGPTTLGETMMQLVMHSNYHRGQINARLRSLGAEPPMLDFIVWLWLGKPKEEWPK